MSLGANWRIYAVGRTVTVLYDPAKPHVALVESGGWELYWPAVVIPLGAILMFVGFRLGRGLVW